ncbi:hypothetical protein [Ancylomarina longa]|uniref:Uncharacterized protein n=1 Tax=Ancylomarina longa TaxID=2487017 RepID=A0A434AVF9_9BACT|nr:hypothetical protein [Ancylomarina longa]RUT78429.1 hypothetical protein DLK05_08905 [Ancylomarina longa]
MGKFLHLFYKIIVGALTFAGLIYWVFDLGAKSEIKRSELNILTKTHEFQKKETRYSDSIQLQRTLIEELQKVVSLMNKTDLVKKVKILKLEKQGLEEKHITTRQTICDLQDSVSKLKFNDVRIQELSNVIEKKEGQIGLIQLELNDTKNQIENLNRTIKFLEVRNDQLNSDLSFSDLKNINFFNSLPYLQEAYFYEMKADDIKCDKHERLPFLFKAYQAYERARKLKVFCKTDLWRVICKMNKIDDDSNRWIITINGIPHDIETSLYKEMLQIKSLSRKNKKSVLKDNI